MIREKVRWYARRAISDQVNGLTWLDFRAYPPGNEEYTIPLLNPGYFDPVLPSPEEALDVIFGGM